MRHLIIAVCTVVCFIHPACNEPPLEPDHQELLSGKWLILYPDHRIKSRTESEVYGKYQDSIVKLYGLKLVSFDSNGQFRQSDSVNTIGKWLLGSDSTVEIRNGGKGFNGFFTKWEKFENDTLRLMQYLPLENKQIQLVWHLKKIREDDDKSILFEDSLNTWRKKPSKPETDEAIRLRLSQMLNFYADYFFLVGKESTYFIPARVALPFKYYQHALTLSPESSPQFRNCFFNEEQAGRARSFLDQTIKKLEGEYPREKDFVTEYARFMEIMARVII